MLKETETEEAIGFFVIGGISVGGAGPLVPPPWLRPCNYHFEALTNERKLRSGQIVESIAAQAQCKGKINGDASPCK